MTLETDTSYQDWGLATVWAGVSLQFVADHEGSHEPRRQMRSIAQWGIRRTFIFEAKLSSLFRLCAFMSRLRGFLPY